MGQDYLISGGEQGIADEDVLRSLLDGDGTAAGEESIDPPLASGIETHQQYDIDSALSDGFDSVTPTDELGTVSFSDVSLYDEPPTDESTRASAEVSPTVEDDLGLGSQPLSKAADNLELAKDSSSTKEDYSVSLADDIFSQSDTPSAVVSADLANSEAGIALSPSADLIEPDLSLIEENLKFDEDDLRNSTDEDWALELLAELEGTGKYKDSTDASDAYVKELLADTESTRHDVNEVSDSSSGGQKHRTGLGFEEIIVDAVPPSEEDLDGKNSATSEQAAPNVEAGHDTSVQTPASLEPAASTSPSEFTTEFSNANAAPALGKSDLDDIEIIAESDVEPAKPVELESGGYQDSEATDLFEDASSVYQQSPEPVAEQESAPEPAPSVTTQAIDDLINDGGDEQKRRKTDFLPQDIDISRSPVNAAASDKFLDWKWIAGSLGMVVLMLAQYSYFYWNDLTASASTRPMFAAMCNALGCELPPYRSLRNVKTDQLSVRSHPDSKTALIVDIILTNKAELAQPFPVLQLTFFDIRSQPVATRKFFPNEYLDGELRGLSSMPSDNPIRLALEIMDPGADAINYELNLLPTL
ncbi:MAG: DUF3426 domain-containing protein [Pseudomonadales bacterium]